MFQFQVPDKITLEATSAPPISGSGGESGRAAGIPHYPTSEVRKQGVPEATNVPLRNVQAAPNPQFVKFYSLCYFFPVFLSRRF